MSLIVNIFQNEVFHDKSYCLTQCLTFLLAVIDPPDDFPMKEIDLNDPEISTLRLRGLLPERTYRLYIWARTKIGRGKGYEIETVTLPDGRKYAHYTCGGLPDDMLHLINQHNYKEVHIVYFALGWVTLYPTRETNKK